jgi:decaprenylphospho-beta-D-ribofuranose 2-oxidase
VLTRGLGRSYGDASLPPAGRGPVACSIAADRVLAFDEESGLLRAEAGLGLAALADLFLPRGFFVPVSPGTREVTLGGMVAADVHGKNHHVAGTLGAHVRALRLRLPDGSIREIDDAGERDLFRATLGGMGLTGHILDVTLRLVRVPSRGIVEETTRYSDLESLIDGLERAGATWPFTVAWSDFLASGSAFGGGLLMAGRWASAAEACDLRGNGPSIPVPFAMPERLLGNAGVGCFHRIRWHRASARATTRLRPMESFFHPLDALRDWNLLYGRRGFTQYQCVLPRDPSLRSYRRLAEIAVGGGPGPFLAVLKDCGDEGIGTLSFPRPGISFALDFPVHEGTKALVSRLNEAVIDAGGRVYLAKDAFTTAAEYAAMEPRREAFLAVKRRIDPEHKVASALSRRLGLTD